MQIICRDGSGIGGKAGIGQCGGAECVRLCEHLAAFQPRGGECFRQFQTAAQALYGEDQPACAAQAAVGGKGGIGRGGRIEAEHGRKQNGVQPPVRQVKRATQCVRKRMTYTESGVVKGNSRHGRSFMDAAASKSAVG